MDKRWVNDKGVVSYTLSTGILNSTTYNGSWATDEDFFNHLVETHGGCWYCETIPTDPANYYYTNHQVRLTQVVLSDGTTY